MCQEKLVQEAVDTLLDNGLCGQPIRDSQNKVYKSFSDVIYIYSSVMLVLGHLDLT